MKKLGITAICLFILTSCTSVNNRGQYVDDKQISNIQIFKTRKEAVIENCGTPNFISEFEKNRWYYISRLTRDNLLNKPKIISQRILILEFNSNGFVCSKEIVDNENININISKDKTVVEGTEKGVIRSYIGNIGKFSKTPNKKHKNK